ncbi:MAG: helix-turn-helix domain-containing protein [Thermoplasmata archaeon]|nr:helix-turn-helix domain-containing protein [Thermoplasmata archaeon]
MERKLPPCPVEVTLSVIGSKWKVLVLRDLMPGTKRFGELEESLSGVSRKVLASVLKDMEAQGLLTRTAYDEIPPRVEYDLTDLGRSLQPMLDSMMVWGEEYRAYAQSHPE